MKKTFLFLFFSVILVACGSKNKVSNDSSNKESLTIENQINYDYQTDIGSENYAAAIEKINSLIAMDSIQVDYTISRYKAMILQIKGEKAQANSVYQSIIDAPEADIREKKIAKQLMAINNKPKESESIESQIKVKKDSINIEENFQPIEELPIFPGCENLSNSSRKECMFKSISKHIRRTIDHDIVDVTLNTGSIRSYVRYMIDTTGHVSNINVMGKNKFLNLEAHRVIAQLPLMKPAIQKGEEVNISYTIPIRFTIE